MANMSARNVWRMKMSYESEKCGRVGCRKKVKMLDAWAIRDGLLFCSKECYMKYIMVHDPISYNKLRDRRFS